MADLSGLLLVGPGGITYQLLPMLPQHGQLAGLVWPQIGPVIKQLRESKGHSQRHFANVIGITHAALNRIEKGKTKKPHRKIVEAIEKALA